MSPSETLWNDTGGWRSFIDGHVEAFGTTGGGGGGGGGGTWNNGNGPMFGFNLKSTYGSTANQWYLRSGETMTAINARYVAGFGNFLFGKEFHSGIPGGYSSLNWPTFPSVVCCNICMSWTPGTISSGANDAAIIALASSIPAGKTAVLSWNEVDGAISGTQQTQYIADMDHMFDLIASLSTAGTVWVADCFRGSYIISGVLDVNVWVPNPAKRNALVLDCYQNDYSTDATGATRYGAMASAADSLTLPWFLGETGDRRPGSNASAAPDDASRATQWNTRLRTLTSGLSTPPLGVGWFDVIGSTGDHRIKQSTLVDGSGTDGPDTNMLATAASFYAASQGA